MHKLYYFLIYLFVFGSHAVFSQKKAAKDSIKPIPVSSTKATDADTADITRTTPFRPVFGLGTGVFTFYGDINSKHLAQLNTSRFAYDFSVSQNITNYLNLRFYVLFGKIGMSDLNPYRHLNFESQIRMGGVHLSYNFHQLLSSKRGFEPYFSIGVESFEYLSKTDLKDAYGNAYNYWSDGSIRNIAENAPNAINAITIKRDYTYETDIRELNLDGFGKYKEQGWAYSIGGGGTWLLTNQWQLRLGMAMYFSNTDLIDGIAKGGEGVRSGDARNDRFLLTSFSINYKIKERSKKDKHEIEVINNVDFLALEKADRDGDGVLDLDDSCQFTPKGAPVDAKGCPYNADKDIVLDYKDMELTSLPFAVVDTEGVTISDAKIDLAYRQFKDSTGEFNEKLEFVTAVPGARKINSNVFVVPYNADFTVQLAQYTTAVPADEMGKLLNILDIRSLQADNNATLYAAGKFKNAGDAITRMEELKTSFPQAKVIYKQNKKYVDYAGPMVSTKIESASAKQPETESGTTNTVLSPGKRPETKKEKPGAVKNTTVSNNKKKNNNYNKSSGDAVQSAPENVVFWVQLGAYRRKTSRDLFDKLPNVVVLHTEDYLYKYLTGSSRSFEEAAKIRIDMLEMGYEDAFIIAFKDGKKVALHTVGATAIDKKDINNLQGPEIIIENDSVPEDK